LKDSRIINRRSFLKLIILAATGLFLYLWFTITGRNRILTTGSSVIKIDTVKLSNGTYFYDDFILFLKNGNARFYSNKCTHAGCRINREIGGELVCTCHGSRFDPESGKVLRGPAGLPLKSLSHWIDAKTGETNVKL
jgi:Rieske Fe-S protein